MTYIKVNVRADADNVNKQKIAIMTGGSSGHLLLFLGYVGQGLIDGINTAKVLGNDNAASSVKGEEQKRRGVAGLVFAYKTAGAAAEKGYTLEYVKSK